MPIAEKTSLILPKDLKQALVLHRIRTGMAAHKAVVAGASVDEVERALGIPLPRELVAVFAATGRDPYEMVVLTEEAREEDGLPPHLIAVALEPAEEASVSAYWCLDSRAVSEQGREMARWTLDPNHRKEGLSILDFIEACFDACDPTDDEMVAVRGLISKLRPAMVSEPRTSFRRVFHHRFGSGFVLREFNDGNQKLEVEFPRVGIKLLLASYVQDAADASTARERRSHANVRRTQ